ARGAEVALRLRGLVRGRRGRRARERALRRSARVMLFDTHCHVDAERFPEGADAVFERARSAGVGAFTCIGVGSLELARAAVALAERRPDVVATVGIHPHDAASADAALEAELAALAVHPRVVAIGEVGLDFHYDHP